MKKVKCIDSTYANECLTIGKIYEVIKEATLLYWVINDRGVAQHWFKKRFEGVE